MLACDPEITAPSSRKSYNPQSQILGRNDAGYESPCTRGRSAGIRGREGK
jgi:hypothetical protein